MIGASDGGVYNGAARTITWVVNLTKSDSKVFYVNVTVNTYDVLNNTVSVGNKTARVNVTVPKVVPSKTVNNTRIQDQR